MSTLVYLALSAAAGGIVGGVGAGRLPYAVPVCVFAAVIASVTVSLPLGDLGMHVAEVALVPAAIGAVTGAVVMRLLLERLVPHTQ